MVTEEVNGIVRKTSDFYHQLRRLMSTLLQLKRITLKAHVAMLLLTKIA